MQGVKALERADAADGGFVHDQPAAAFIYSKAGGHQQGISVNALHIQPQRHARAKVPLAEKRQLVLHICLLPDKIRRTHTFTGEIAVFRKWESLRRHGTDLLTSFSGACSILQHGSMAALHISGGGVWRNILNGIKQEKCRIMYYFTTK